MPYFYPEDDPSSPYYHNANKPFMDQAAAKFREKLDLYMRQAQQEYRNRETQIQGANELAQIGYSTQATKYGHERDILGQQGDLARTRYSMGTNTRPGVGNLARRAIGYPP